MAPTRHNPNGLTDGMVVRKVSSPAKVFRVRGNPDAGGATFVALSKGERTVLNGNARNYRPETDLEEYDRIDVPPRSASPELSEHVGDSDDVDGSDYAALSDDPGGPSRTGYASGIDPSGLTDEPDQDREREPSKPLRALRAVEAYQEPDIVELCDRMRDAVTRLDDDTCSPEDAAVIVRAAAELNWAVSNNR